MSCIVNSLADDYLHIDLSHISPSSFVAADAVTIFNLFEILDGLLDFMLEQIEVESDSGGEIKLSEKYFSSKTTICLLLQRKVILILIFPA